MKYTFLSRWTVLLLTLIAAGLLVLGFGLFGATFGGNLTLPKSIGFAILSLLVAIGLYAAAWIVGFLDSLQERKFGWSLAMVVLIPFLIGPLLYSVFGPRNTR
jgi:hypothetical protein